VMLSSGKAARPLGASAVGKVENDDRADWSEVWVLFPGTVVYVWHAGIKAGIVQASLEACGLDTRAQIGLPHTLRPSPSSSASNPVKACHRFTATSTYAGAISMAWQARPVCSAAIIVVPEPQNGS